MPQIKNLTKAATRITQAIQDQEPIVLYGDSDLDGTSSVIILQETLKTLGGKVVAVYFPEREKEGYGITRTGLEVLEKHAPALFIAMDLGISNFQEILLAKEKGFEVMLLDHHEVLGKLPAADIIVDPKQPGETYPFHGFAACGVVLKLAEQLLGKDVSPSLRRSLVEIAALGTIADMMPKEHDNTEIIEEGMETIEQSWRPGIKAFFDVPEFQDYPNIATKVSKLISVLNARDVQDGMPASFRVLSCPSEDRAKDMVRDLIEKNRIRKQQIQELAEKVRKSLAQNNDFVIVQGGLDFAYMHLGAVASIISQEQDKPVFLYMQQEKESMGSVRAPAEYDVVKAMQSCADLFVTYGGHAQAAGFRLKNTNIAKLKESLNTYFKTYRD
jgi:single-stranded-DNA-specific exonuclease